MYTYKEAQKLIDYYSSKVIGKEIKESEFEKYLIEYLEIKELNGGSFNVFCYSRASISTLIYRNIKTVAKDLGLISPTELINPPTKN